MSSSSYQVIARRWRPQQFTELVGQDHIVRTLTNAIEQDRIAHAYLFVGPRGTGKTSTARLFAKALNCENGPSINPSNDSEICQAIMLGSCMDVIEIDGASNNSVDQVRELRESCQYAPAQCRFKIYIIDEVHMLSTAAFNALLKTLEEPPSHVKFIFATTESHKVLPTIVSRCQRFEFRPISDAVIIEKLAHIAQAEGLQADSAALKAIARLAGGGMRDAQSILDQLVAFCGNTISESDVLDVYGLTAPESIQKLARALASTDYEQLIVLADKLADEGRDLHRALIDLQAFLREVLLAAIKNKGQIETLGPVMRSENLMRMLDSLHASEGTLKFGLSEKVNFEVALLKASEQAKTRAIDSLIQEMSQLDAGALEASASKKKSDSSLDKAPAGVVIESEKIIEKPVKKKNRALEVPIAQPILEAAEPDVLIESVKKNNAGKIPLEEAIQQIPESIRKTLDEKFRAHYTHVVDSRN